MSSAATGVFISGFSSILTGLNFIVTVHKMRAPGMTWGRLPLFVWSNYATALIQVWERRSCNHDRSARLRAALPRRNFRSVGRRRSHPVPAPVLVLLAPRGLHHDPAWDGRDQRTGHVLFEKGVFGYSFVAGSSLGIAVIGFLVWGHHLFVTGQSMYASMVFSLLSFLVAVPSAIKVFNWTATMYRGSVSFETPMLYAFGFIGLFTIGGLTGLFLATTGDRYPRH